MNVIEYDEAKLVLRQAGKEAMIMKEILNHRGPLLKRDYLVKFIDNTQSWVPSISFPSTYLIQLYWQKINKRERQGLSTRNQ